MAKSQDHYLIFLFLISPLVVDIQATKFDNDKQVQEYQFYMENFNASNVIDRISTQNWTENLQCWHELIAIKNGLDNREKWAIRVVGSWGNFPTGLQNGKVFEPGLFSECFHIEQNGESYKTQYCVANFEPNITLGICLPANCEIEHLESMVNYAVHSDLKYMKMKIPENMCQLEESATNLEPIDFVTIGLFGVVLLLMISNTFYDIYCTVYILEIFQPFIVFSIYTNGKKLFACKNFGPSSGVIQCIDGIRVISIIWIVSCHIFEQYSHMPLHERVPLEEFQKSYASVIPYVHLAVDTFLMISGLLVSYKMLKLIKKNGKLDILSLYWHRYLRLTPLLGACVLISASVYHIVGSGPLWPSIVEVMVDPCKTHWWCTLIYVQNYMWYEPRLCMKPTWYLSVDMQLFIIAPFLVYLLHWYKKPTLIAMVTSIVCCTAYTITEYVNRNLLVYFQGVGYIELFFSTHTRFPSWLIGFIAGFILFKYPRGSIRIPKKLNLCAWSFILIALLIIVLETHPYYQDVPTRTALVFGLYETISRIVWCIAVAYIIFACVHESGGPINEFLSLPMWQPISRLSYAIFLIHVHIMKLTMGSMRVQPYFSVLSAIQNVISVFVLTTFIAIPLVLAFELPIDAINKLTTGLKNKKQRSSSLAPDNLTNNQLSSLDIREVNVKTTE